MKLPLTILILTLTLTVVQKGFCSNSTIPDSIKELLNSEEYEKAILELEKSISNEQTSSQAEVHNVIGWAYFKIDSIQKALHYLKKALHIAKKIKHKKLETVTSNNLGLVYFFKNELAKAEIYFKKPETINTEISRKYLLLIKTKKSTIEQIKSERPKDQ